MKKPQRIYISGLPRSGSTLMCQLLGNHPDIYSLAHSSPLQAILENMRYNLSDNPFLLSQLDVDFEHVHQRLKNVYQSVIDGWFKETDKPYVVDKNRGWLKSVELLAELDPDFKMIICIRDPIQIFGSVEKQHKKTRMIDFPDHISHHSSFERAQSLFNETSGVIGEPMKFIKNMQDISDPEIKNRLCYLPFESVISEPEKAMKTLFEWLGVPDHQINFDQLKVTPHESDSYYRFKYSHKQFNKIKNVNEHTAPQRVVDLINKDFAWFYEWFYNKPAANSDIENNDQ